MTLPAHWRSINQRLLVRHRPPENVWRSGVCIAA